MNENTTIENTEAIKKPKNPKRVAAGKKGAEVKKMKAELKRKEAEVMKKENIELREQRSINSITKDDDEVKLIKKDITKDGEEDKVNIYKNYIPLALIGVVGLGIYMYKSKQVEQSVTPMIQQQTVAQPIQLKKSDCIDPFEFN